MSNFRRMSAAPFHSPKKDNDAIMNAKVFYRAWDVKQESDFVTEKDCAVNELNQI